MPSSGGLTRPSRGGMPEDHHTQKARARLCFCTGLEARTGLDFYFFYHPYFMNLLAHLRSQKFSSVHLRLNTAGPKNILYSHQISEYWNSVISEGRIFGGTHRRVFKNGLGKIRSIRRGPPSGFGSTRYENGVSVIILWAELWVEDEEAVFSFFSDSIEHAIRLI